MTVARLVKWWSICVLVGVIAVVVWSYVSAHGQRRLPLHHPWPAVSLIGGAAVWMFIGARRDAKAPLILRVAGTLLMMLAASLYMWSLL